MAEVEPSTWKCPDCGESVDSSNLGFLADVACPKCGRAGHANTKLANFQLDSILGIGDMSVVMRAYDPALGRPVAIKLLSDTYRDQEDRIRKFEAECSLMAKVRHENVVSVYSAGWARGQFYIAMELVDGENLELIIDRRRFLLPNQAVDIIRQVALGLKAAHEAGLLHRDVKPGNVIITRNHQAKVLDFGLSMEDLQEEGDKEEIIWATPFYVPPETLRREHEDVRSDIYALGMTLRNLLTGEDKLNGEFHSVSSLLQLKEKYPTMRSTYPHLDAELCDFVDRMSAFKPDDRPADYDEVLAELAEVSEHLAKAGQRRATRLWLAEKKREIMILAGAALLGIILATTVVCSTTVVKDQRYLNISTEPTTPEWQELAKAREMLISTHWNPAADLYAKLAEKADDHPVGLHSALLGAALKTMLQEQDAAAKCLNCANRHLAAAKEDSQMAQGDWQEMEQVLRILQGDGCPDVHTVDAQRQPMLRVVLAVLAAADAMDDARVTEAQSLVDAAVAVAEQGGGGVGELVTILNRYKLELAHQAVPKLRQLVLRQLGGGMLEQARESMDRLTVLQLSPAEKAELELQRELCQVAESAFNAYRKHGQDPKLLFVSPKLAHDAALRVTNNHAFVNEMSCLVLMLRGEYAKAFAADPYKDSADSRKPFAVLMRHWRQMLGAQGPAPARSLPAERRETANTAAKANAVAQPSPSGADASQVDPDKRAAFERALKAANNGDREEIVFVSYCYRNGKGVEKNVPESIRWMRKLADQGDAAAMVAIGYSSYDGEDFQEAAKWWRKAAELGDSHAQSQLGKLYKDGKGVPRDLQEALKWFRKAAEQGDKQAEYWLQELGGQ